MITEQAIKNWMRQQLAEKQYDNAAALAREFLEQHQIRDVLSPSSTALSVLVSSWLPKLHIMQNPSNSIDIHEFPRS
jgi:hypothetical protein